MNKVLKERIMRAFSAVLPISVIMFISSVILVPMPSGIILMFLVGSALLVVGMGFFTLGADMALRPMGEVIAIQLTKRSHLFPIIIISFAVGAVIAIAEVDLQMLAKQVAVVPYWHIILGVAVGMGLLLAVAVLRTLFKIRLSVLLIVFYGIVFGMCYFMPDFLIPFAFEAGGIATGPIAIPIILAIGLSLASVRSDKDSVDDSFGMVALAKIGPIIALLSLGIFYKPSEAEIRTALIKDALTSRDVITSFAVELPRYLKEVTVAIGCILICFLLFQLVSRRFHRHQLGRIMVGFFYAFIGMVLFFTGIHEGFVPVGQLLGSQLAALPHKWILIPLGTLIGYFLVTIEPEVFIFNKQVEEMSEGTISVKMMNRGLAISMALAIAITMTRILLGIPIIYILIPGYLIALTLTFFVPKIFAGIAFDSGAVCSGPMCAIFLLPFAMGVAEGAGRNLMTFAIGIVIIVAMTPLIVIQIMGLVYQVKTRAAAALTEAETTTAISTVAAGRVIDWGKITVFGENG